MGGDLPSSIIQPIFLADPGHRIKCMAKPIFALANLSLKKSTCRKVHALRLKKYIGFYIKQNRKLGYQALKKNRMAPVDHLFDSHKSCDKKWCWIKEMCELGNHTRCKYEWCKNGKKEISPTLICLPCDAGIMHPFPLTTYPNYTTEPKKPL